MQFIVRLHDDHEIRIEGEDGFVARIEVAAHVDRTIDLRTVSGDPDDPVLEIEGEKRFRQARGHGHDPQRHIHRSGNATFSTGRGCDNQNGQDEHAGESAMVRHGSNTQKPEASRPPGCRIPSWISENQTPIHEGHQSRTAGLLAPGSSYLPALPTITDCSGSADHRPRSQRRVRDGFAPSSPYSVPSSLRKREGAVYCNPR